MLKINLDFCESTGQLPHSTMTTLGERTANRKIQNISIGQQFEIYVNFIVQTANFVYFKTNTTKVVLQGFHFL